MEVLCEISNFCRFCLSQDTENLILLSSAIAGLSFSFQDIQQTTGISILESETGYLAVCIKCKNRVELAVDFRRSCLDGNAKFLQLFGHIIDKLRSSDFAEENLEDTTCVTGDPLEVEIILQNEPANENTCVANDECVLPVKDSPNKVENNSSEDLLPATTNLLRPKRKTTNTKVAVPASKQRKAKSKERIGEIEADLANKPNKPKTTGKYRKQLCGICGTLVYHLADHIRSHTKENLHKCPHCPVQMANRTNLMTHVRSVHEKVVVKTCEPCGKGFVTYNTYKMHMRLNHNIGERYQCEICPKIFNSPSTRSQHMKRMHIVEWKYECQNCPKKFKDGDALKRHGRVHSTNTPYACSQCPKRFKSAFAKKTHEITHSGIQFPCTLCTKVYRYKSLLSMHYRKCHPAECSGESTQQSDPICDQ